MEICLYIYNLKVRKKRFYPFSRIIFCWKCVFSNGCQCLCEDLCTETTVYFLRGREDMRVGGSRERAQSLGIRDSINCGFSYSRLEKNNSKTAKNLSV